MNKITIQSKNSSPKAKQALIKNPPHKSPKTILKSILAYTPAEDRASYRKRKSLVHELESHNFSQLILYYNSKSWYLIGGNSAIIYAHDLAPRFGNNSITLRPDKDTDHIFPHGTTSVKLSNFSSLVEKLQTLNVTLSDFDSANNIIYFTLPAPYTTNSIKNFVNSRDKYLARITKTAVPDNSFPILLTYSQNFFTDLTSRLGNTPALLRHSLCIPILNDLELAIFSLTKNTSRPLEKLTNFSAHFASAKIRLSTLSRSNFISVTSVSLISQSIEKIDNRLELELNKLNQKGSNL